MGAFIWAAMGVRAVSAVDRRGPLPRVVMATFGTALPSAVVTSACGHVCCLPLRLLSAIWLSRRSVLIQPVSCCSTALIHSCCSLAACCQGFSQNGLGQRHYRCPGVSVLSALICDCSVLDVA